MYRKVYAIGKMKWIENMISTSPYVCYMHNLRSSIVALVVHEGLVNIQGPLDIRSQLLFLPMRYAFIEVSS